MITEITNVTEETGGGWVLYDAECQFCVALARRWETALARRKFRLAPLQTEGSRAGLQNGSELLREMRVVTAQGRVFGGAAAVVELSRHFWWAGWLRGVASLPLGKRALDAGYRWIAARRYCLGGACAVKVSGGGEQATEPGDRREILADGSQLVGLKPCGRVARRTGAGAVARPTRNEAGEATRTAATGPMRWWDAWPLLGLPVIAALATWNAPAWVLMWSVAFAQFVGIKWLIWRDANPTAAGIVRTLGFFLFWPGMDARRFHAPAKRETPPALGEWITASFKTALGVLLVWGMSRTMLGTLPLAAGWCGMIGLVFFLHFGLFHLLSLAWRAAGVDAPPIMHAPLRATSLSDFWGERWNLGFSVPARRLIVKPIAPLLGQSAATLLVFLMSGLLHELVVTVPARAGYGLPTAYFLAQGAAILFERSSPGRRLGLGGGWRGRCFALLFAAGPAFWLFNPAFVYRVILPFLQAIGAT